MGTRFTFTRTRKTQISKKFFIFFEQFLLIILEQHSSYADFKLSTQTYKNICYAKIKVKNSESISIKSPYKISFNLSLQINSSKSLVTDTITRKLKS